MAQSKVKMEKNCDLKWIIEGIRPQKGNHWSWWTYCCSSPCSRAVVTVLAATAPMPRTGRPSHGRISRECIISIWRGPAPRNHMDCIDARSSIMCCKWTNWWNERRTVYGLGDGQQLSRSMETWAEPLVEGLAVWGYGFFAFCDVMRWKNCRGEDIVCGHKYRGYAHIFRWPQRPKYCISMTPNDPFVFSRHFLTILHFGHTEKKNVIEDLLLFLYYLLHGRRDED